MRPRSAPWGRAPARGKRALWDGVSFVRTRPEPAEVRSLYDSMVRIVVKPTWAKLIDFDETLPTAVEELIRRRDARRLA